MIVVPNGGQFIQCRPNLLRALFKYSPGRIELLPYLTQRKISTGFTHIIEYVIFDGIPAVAPGLIFDGGEAVYFRQSFAVKAFGEHFSEHGRPEEKQQQGAAGPTADQVIPVKVREDRV